MTRDSIHTLLGDQSPDSKQPSPFLFENCVEYREVFRKLARLGIPSDLLSIIAAQVDELIPALSDPQRALINLERFFLASRNPLSLAALFERDKTGLGILLKMFSGSQHLADILVSDPESYDGLRLFAGQPIARETLIRELCDEINKAKNTNAAMRILRRFKRRETLRIAYGDMIAQQDIDTVTRQISYLADGICQAALEFAERMIADKYNWPLIEGRRCRFVIFALGKLGGNELNYSSDIDLVMIFESNGETEGPRKISNAEYFQRLARETIRLMSENTELSAAYRVDMRLRPDGDQGPLVMTANAALSYYDMKGRNWERQAFIKARPAAGDLEFGEHWIEQLKSWIYPLRLSHTDISGIKSLRRRIERQSEAHLGDGTNVKTGSGGIRDVEFVVQFMQLLHGRYHPRLQTFNTLTALKRMLDISLLTNQEFQLLDHNYRWLRRLEHRLQIMFDLKTHSLPGDPAELKRLAIRMGYDDRKGKALQSFEKRLQTVTKSNREILDHLLQNAFPDSEGEQISEEVDLVLEPNPDAKWIESVLARYGFADTKNAYTHLIALASEDVFFLPQARCRHFLASISRQLLEEISQTPDPQQTLVALNRVSQNIGGKAVLWELFSKHSLMLKLFIRMCSACPYLCDILASHPGMIDGLLDSLLMQHLPSRRFLRGILRELTHNAKEIDLIIHAFKDSQHLRVGVRDLTGRDPIFDVQAALSDIAEVCLQTITQFELAALVERFGRPTFERNGEVVDCEFVILAMGKLGGREPNYHSDLDVMFLYQCVGSTEHGDSSKQTSNQDFFSRLAASITKRMTSIGPYGRLYELDSRLRPTGKSGSLAVSFQEFSRYFTNGSGQLWERQALCKARAITGSSAARREVRHLVREAIVSEEWQPEMANRIREMRNKWQEGATPRNLKRGIGGTVDIEFAIQMLQLKFASSLPHVLLPGTLAAGSQLFKSGILSEDNWRIFDSAYQTLRYIEARLRLMDLPKYHDLPDGDSPLRKLSYLLDYATPQQLELHVDTLRKEVRMVFDQLFDQHSSRPN